MQKESTPECMSEQPEPEETPQQTTTVAPNDSLEELKDPPKKKKYSEKDTWRLEDSDHRSSDSNYDDWPRREYKRDTQY